MIRTFALLFTFGTTQKQTNTRETDEPHTHTTRRREKEGGGDCQLLGSNMGKTNTPWWRCLKPKKKTEMAFYDKLVMSPWDKWNKHNRFPWKPIVHLGISLFSAFLVCSSSLLFLLSLLSSSLTLFFFFFQVLLYVTEYAAYTRSTTDTYHLLFVPEGGKILSINDCVAAINNSIITVRSSMPSSFLPYSHFHLHLLMIEKTPQYSQFTNQSVDQYMIPKQEGSYKDPIITMDVSWEKKKKRETDELEGDEIRCSLLQ